MRAVLNFKLLWDALLNYQRYPDCDITKGPSTEETLKFYRDCKERLPELDEE